jgi:hypothetical protein
MPPHNVTRFVLRQTVAEKPVRGAQPATIHTFVNGVSFMAAILRLLCRTCVAWFRPRPDMQKEMITIKQEKGRAVPAGPPAVIFL